MSKELEDVKAGTLNEDSHAEGTVGTQERIEWKAVFASLLIIIVHPCRCLFGELPRIGMAKSRERGRLSSFTDLELGQGVARWLSG